MAVIVVLAAAVLSGQPLVTLGGVLITARDQQPAPTTTPDADSTKSALAALDRPGLFGIYAARAGASLTVVTELTPQAIQSGRWKDGADLEIALANDSGDIVANAHGRIGAGADATLLTIPITGMPVRVSVRVRDGRGTAADAIPVGVSGVLVGDPLAYRTAVRIDSRPVANFAFGRNERIRIEWPVLAPLDKRDIRLLDRNGHPIPVELPLADDSAHKTLVLAMGLSGFGAGDYLIELTASGQGVSERKLLAIRVK